MLIHLDGDCTFPENILAGIDRIVGSPTPSQCQGQILKKTAEPYLVLDKQLVSQTQ